MTCRVLYLLCATNNASKSHSTKNTREEDASCHYKRPGFLVISEKTFHISRNMNGPPSTPISNPTYHQPQAHGYNFAMPPHTPQVLSGSSPSSTFSPPSVQQWDDNQFSGQNTSPSPQAGSVVTPDGPVGVVRPIFIDNLAKDFQLDAKQTRSLHTFVEVCPISETKPSQLI